MVKSIIKSPLLDGITSIKHFFSTRFSEFSEGSKLVLNVGNDGKGRAVNIDTSLETLARLLNIPKEKVVWPKQVNGSGCLLLRKNDDEKVVFRSEADSLITDKPLVMIAVKTADCCPILIASEEYRVVAVVHSGWKGTLSKNLEKTIDKMEKIFAIKRESVKISIGPSIGFCCYNIADERAEIFKRQLPFSNDFISVRDSKTYLDLKGINREMAIRAGILASNIDLSSFCTCCRKDLFHSFRRNGEISGRQYSGIMLMD